MKAKLLIKNPFQLKEAFIGDLQEWEGDPSG